MAEQLKATLDVIPDLLFELGLDGRYYSVHSPNESLLAASPSYLIGKTVPQVLAPESAAIVMDALQEAHEKGWSQGKQYQRKTALGPSKPILSPRKIRVLKPLIKVLSP